MPTPLRPLTVGEIADRAAALYRRDFPLLFSLAFIPHALLYLITVTFMLLTSGAAFVSEETATGVWMVSSPLLMIGAIFVGVLRVASLASALSDRYLGRPATLRGAYRVGLGAWLRVFTTELIGTVLITIGFLVGVVPGAILTGMAIFYSPNLVVAILASLILFVVSVTPGFFLFLRFLFAVYLPVVPVIEGQWAVDGLVRSWKLMGYRSPEWGPFGTNPYRATALFVLLFAVYLSVVFLAELPYYLLVAYQTYEQVFEGGPVAMDPAMGAPLWLLIPTQLLAVTAQALLVPFAAAVFTIYYYDLRVRREGLDLFMELQEEPADGVPA